MKWVDVSWKWGLTPELRESECWARVELTSPELRWGEMTDLSWAELTWTVGELTWPKMRWGDTEMSQLSRTLEGKTSSALRTLPSTRAARMGRSKQDLKMEIGIDIKVEKSARGEIGHQQVHAMLCRPILSTLTLWHQRGSKSVEGRSVEYGWGMRFRFMGEVRRERTWEIEGLRMGIASEF